MIFQNQFDPLDKLITAAVAEFEEFKQAQNVPNLTHITLGTRRCMARWKKSRQLDVKANWDAAIDTKEKKVGLGVILRDSEGDILANNFYSVV